jgi:hypothetical protein
MRATLLLHPQSRHYFSNHGCYISSLEHWLLHLTNTLHSTDKASARLRDDEQLVVHQHTDERQQHAEAYAHSPIP